MKKQSVYAFVRIWMKAVENNIVWNKVELQYFSNMLFHRLNYIIFVIEYSIQPVERRSIVP